MKSDILISGDQLQSWWIKNALAYLPENILRDEGPNLAIVGVGAFGGCRLPKQYREREIILLSDWIFPPVSHSEAEETGKFFIVTLLHELAHAVSGDKSPHLDNLPPDRIEKQERKADSMAIDWYNRHVESLGDENLTLLDISTFRELVDRFGKLYDAIGKFKWDWHKNRGTS